MKAIIVYYSFTGNNQILAKELQARLDCETHEVIESKKRTNLSMILDSFFSRKPGIQPWEADWSAYDRIILIAPIWNGKIAAPLKTFIDNEKHNFKDYAFISICGQRGNNKIEAELTKIARRKPLSVLQLPVNDLLPPIKKDKFWHASAYKVQQEDCRVFDKEIADFFTRIGLKEKAAEQVVRITAGTPLRPSSQKQSAP